MVAVSAAERANWNAIDGGNSELVLARCVRVDIRKPLNRISVVLTFLTDEDQPREVLRYFSALPCSGKNERNECRIKENSYLAKLYRSTKGKNLERYNRAKSYAKQLLGLEFLIDPYPNGEGVNFEYRTLTVLPKYPIKADLWGDTGKLYHHEALNKISRKYSENRTKTGQSLDKKRTKDGQTLDREIYENPHSYLVSANDSTPNNQSTVNRTPVTIVNSPVIEVIDNFGTTVKQIGDKERFFQYQQQPNETLEQCEDRMMDKSLI